MKSCAVALIAVYIITVCSAWGFQGHQLTASLAERLLSPSAALAIRQLMPTSSENLTTISTWADTIKRNPAYRWTSGLHYVNPVDDEPRVCSFDMSRDCANGKCVVGAILNFTQRVGDKNLDKNQRYEALKFLVHYIGDIHQPLHVSGRERGGNGALAKFGNAKTNLHSVWDSALLKKRMSMDFGNSQQSFFAHLLRRTTTSGGELMPSIRSWTSCDSHNVQNLAIQQLQHVFSTEKTVDSSPVCPDQWAVQINALNCKYVWKDYSPTTDLSQQYYQTNYDIIEQSLISGGTRLAAVLNYVFQ